MSTDPAPGPEAAELLAALRYPLQVDTILRKRKRLRRLLDERGPGQPVRIALLGGATTHELRELLELFLRARGFTPTFYESDYARYYEDGALGTPELDAFRPQLAIVFTTTRNLGAWPRTFATAAELDAAVDRELTRLRAAWERLHATFGCMVVQNNFEQPAERPLGPIDATLEFGRVGFVARLNRELAAAARATPWLVINDLHWLSATLGLDRWYDKTYWYHYKLPMSQDAAVHAALALANLIGGVFGRTRKVLVLDLDNTLWGGVIGDDGLGGIKLGRDNPLGEAYVEFQLYCKALRERGVLLAVCSKNEPDTARSGFGHPDAVLTLDDFAAFEAGWGPKHEALLRIADTLNLGVDSLVFVDDNPAERALVAAQLPDVAVPEVGVDVARYAEIVERNGYFDAAALSTDDAARAEMYLQNARRERAAATYTDYADYLRSLEMVATIAPVDAAYLPRVVQLVNKTNQWNLTTRRYTLAEFEALTADPTWITLYGRLADKFGDNGLIAVAAGRLAGTSFHVELWLMSCRVLKRDFELAMFDELVARAHARGATEVVGYYARTAKNAMVAELYPGLGFTLDEASDDGARTRWTYPIPSPPVRRNQTLKELTHG